MPDPTPIELAADRIADVMENAASANNDMLEAEAERLGIPVRDLMEAVSDELLARFAD